MHAVHAVHGAAVLHIRQHQQSRRIDSTPNSPSVLKNAKANAPWGLVEGVVEVGDGHGVVLAVLAARLLGLLAGLVLGAHLAFGVGAFLVGEDEGGVVVEGRAAKGSGKDADGGQGEATKMCGWRYDSRYVSFVSSCPEQGRPIELGKHAKNVSLALLECWSTQVGA